MKAAIYLRTSTTEQHPEKQEADCRQFAISRGYEIEGVFYEQLSGYKQIVRPIYEQIKDKAHKGHIQAVIVWALDRWVRNRDTLLDDVLILRNYNVKLHSVREAYLEAINIDGPLGKTITDFLLGLIGSLAEMESSRKSERMYMAYKSYTGSKWGRPKVHTNKKKIILDLRQQGLSLRQIVSQSGMALGTVHKIISESIPKKPL